MCFVFVWLRFVQLSFVVSCAVPCCCDATIICKFYKLDVRSGTQWHIANKFHRTSCSTTRTKKKRILRLIYSLKAKIEFLFVDFFSLVFTEIGISSSTQEIPCRFMRLWHHVSVYIKIKSLNGWPTWHESSHTHWISVCIRQHFTDRVQYIHCSKQPWPVIILSKRYFNTSYGIFIILSSVGESWMNEQRIESLTSRTFRYHCYCCCC